MKLASGLADVRALGPSAPLRAAYEVSKRVGLHGLVFGRLVPPKGRVPRLVPILGPPAEVPSEAAERTFGEARRVVDGTVVLFGREIRVGERPNWHLLLHDEGQWPADRWWTLDIRSAARLGDVKWAWELGRHRHLVILARAVYLAPAEDAFRTTLEAHLRSWIEQNVPERGVHWYSNLEIALRAISWLQVLALAGERLDPALRRAMARHLYHSGRHLAADLPYTISTMRNNHLLGDALGLVALGIAFPNDPAAARWRRLGDRLMARQLARHIHPDGSMIEDSLSYHRFVLEMLAARVVLGAAPPSVDAALVSGAKFLVRLGVAADPVPQYGDWDEGRVLVSSGRPDHLLGTVRLAAALGGTGAPSEWRREHDELAWYAAEGRPAVLDETVTDGGAVGGGFARAASGSLTVWLKAGSGPSHGHADLSNVAMLVGGHWVVGDPGTGTYNGDPEIRDHFRTSVAHSVLRVEDEDQLVPHRAFRWVNTAKGVVGRPLRAGPLIIMWGVHGAYQRLDGRPRVVRVVLVDEHAATVGDWLEGKPRPYRLSLPLHPGVIWNDPDLELPGGRVLRLDPPEVVNESCGSVRPFDGWWSWTYGAVVPASRLECRGMTRGPVAWSIGDVASPRHSVDGHVLVRDGCRVRVGFLAEGIEVAAVTEGRTEHRYLDFPR